MEEEKLYQIVNVDETTWKIVYHGQLTYAQIGVDQVHINENDNNEKLNLTALTAITASESPDEQKLGMTIIAKGKSPRCVDNLHLSDDVEGIFSSTDWATIPALVKCLGVLQKSHFEKFSNKSNTSY